MEYSKRYRDQGYSTTKSWAKQRRARKYGTRRDVRKANANGDRLKRAEQRWSRDHGNIEIDCEGGINPIEKFLDIRNPNQTDIQSNFASLLEHTNWTSLRRERVNGNRSQIQQEGDGKGTTWSVWYRYSAQEQWEQFNHNLRRQRALKKHDKEYVKERRLRPKHWKKPPRRREYRPPNVEEPVLTIKAIDILGDDAGPCWSARRRSVSVVLDLGRNRWITAFSTRFQWNAHRQRVVHWMGIYKLYVAVDDDDRDRRLYGHDEDEDEDGDRKRRDQRSKKKKVKTTVTDRRGRGYGARWSSTASRRQRKRERNERAKDRKSREFEDKLKWEYVGTFDGSMKGFWYDDTVNFGVDKLHRINHVVHCDHRSNEAMKKHFAKNGKLGRWIKVVPCESMWIQNERQYLDLKDALKAQVYGVSVDRYSQPVIPMKAGRDDIGFDEVGNGDDDGYTAADDAVGDSMDSAYTVSDGDGDSDFEDDQGKNVQIGPRIQSEEVEEGKGCRLVLFEQRPLLEFHREIDGVRGGYCSPDWYFGDIIEKRKQFRRASQCTRKYHRGLSVKDWDIDGTPRW